MSLAFSFIDLVVVVVVLGSMAYAIWRGFVSETLSIVAWAAAAFAALYLGPWAGRVAHALVATEWLATILGYAAAFLVVFIPLSFASYRFAESVRQSPVGPIDRVLGGTFGIVRGLAILGFAYLIFTAFVPILNQPRWLKEARTLPLIQSSAQVLLSIMPRHGHAAAEAQPQATQQAVQPPVASPVHQVKAKSTMHGKKGYGAGERRALDRLFEATGNGGGDKP
jgi:membrane protein required for colicin V production